MTRTAGATHRGPRTLILALATVAALLFGVLGAPTRAESATAQCLISPGATTAYSVKVCLTSSGVGSTVSGEITMTATVTITGTSPGLAKTEFTINDEYVLTDFQSPYSFTLRTTDFVDGAKTVKVSAILRDGYVPPPTPLPLTFANGVTSPPVNNGTWQAPGASPRPWTTPTILAATGDGAGGESNAQSVVNLINSWNPDLFAYTGDVYEDGTITEFRNWYGTAGSWFSAFRDRTLPVVGNHEYTANQAPGYFNYWDNIPHYYSVDINGWHVIGLDTTSQYNQTSPGTPQYDWLVNDLQANNSPCTIVTGHHPLYNIGKELPALRLQGVWNLLAQHGVTMFLVGHDHTYQRWTPLDGSGNPATKGVTELVIGTGGHSSQAAATSDYRVLKYSKSYGAMRLELYGDRMVGSYHTTTGTVADTFTLPCTGADKIAPAPVTGLTGTPDATTAPDGSPVQGARLAWTASTDNYDVTGYRVRRDGAVVAATTTTSWTDSGLASATDFRYSVEALDARGNASDKREVSVRTNGGDTTAPSTPTNLAFTTESPTSIAVTWDASTDNVGVTGYEVTRDGDVVGTVTGTAFEDTVPDATTAHTYTVRAVDAAGNRSDPSAPLEARSLNLTPPNPPTNLQGGVSGADVVLTWEAPASGTDVVGYDVVRDGTKVGEATGPTYTDTPPDSFADHVYEVSSFSAAGVRSTTAASVEVSIGDNVAPSAPTGLGATASGPTSIGLTWLAATDNVGVTGYRVFRNGTQVGSVGGSTLSFGDTNLLSQTSYTYTVRAVDAAGNASGDSEPAGATTSALAGLSATADTYANSSSPSTGYGTSTSLRMDADPDRRPYIMFNVGQGTGSIARARLRVYLQSKSSGFTVHGVSASWTEKGLTWNNAPTPGPDIDNGSIAAAGWVELDVTSLTTGLAPGTNLAVALRTTSVTSVNVSSRETTNKPVLLVDWTG